MIRLRNRNRIAAAVALSAALMAGASGGAAGGTYRHEETTTKIIPLEEAERIILVSASGDITMIGESGRSEVEVTIKKYIRASDEEEARKLAESMGIVVTRPGGDLKLETRYPKRGTVRKSIFSLLISGQGESMQMELVLLVPSGVAADVSSASGTVTVSRLKGPASISTASGSVDVRDIEGSVEVKVASGSIDVADIGGSVDLGSASGNVTARNVGGDAKIFTASGDTDLNGVAGSLEIESRSGDTTVDGVGSVRYRGLSGSGRFVEVRGGVDASAASGDLSFRVVPADGSDYRIVASSGNVTLRFLRAMKDGFVLKAATTSGEITAQLPIRVTRVDRNMIAGIVRDGHAKVFLETSGGDITIEEPEE